jgi:hypothetical protein
MNDFLDEIKTKWSISVTLPMSAPWGKDDIVWLVGEVERLLKECNTAWFERDEARAGLLEMHRERNEARDERDDLQYKLLEQGERLKEAVATEQRLLSMLGTLMKSAERVGNERDAAEARALALGAQVVAQAEGIKQQAKDEQPDLLPCFCAELSGTCPRHPQVKTLP